jgi:hypothetical protein
MSLGLNDARSKGGQSLEEPLAKGWVPGGTAPNARIAPLGNWQRQPLILMAFGTSPTNRFKIA